MLPHVASRLFRGNKICEVKVLSFTYVARHLCDWALTVISTGCTYQVFSIASSVVVMCPS
ncbi:hypothetical protein NTGM5_60097 [Candidatus Nitrotoga sp. M5]|nr:hypothetical protein NTGM5_60097 [Candidatus Nitrotoga sp. M5]